MWWWQKRIGSVGLAEVVEEGQIASRNVGVSRKHHDLQVERLAVCSERHHEDVDGTVVK